MELTWGVAWDPSELCKPAASGVAAALLLTFACELADACHRDTRKLGIRGNRRRGKSIDCIFAQADATGETTSLLGKSG